MGIIEAAFHVELDDNDKWYFLPVCFVIFYPLVLVRKIQAFAKFHIFGDIMIIITIVVICVYAGLQDKKEGFEDSPELKWFNAALWPDAIGFAVYSFEGVGVIIPIYDITADKKNYFKIVCMTCTLIMMIYISFSEFCLFTYYEEFISKDKPLITDYLPASSPVGWLVKFLFCCNLIISYPLVVYPANMVIESYLYAGWPKSKRRQCCKNINRAILVIFICVTALLVYDKLDKFLSIIGSLTCTPIAFILPALFHYKVCAETFW
jgi:solute carrier family 36 (proton-coupled amino acid transporter)